MMTPLEIQNHDFRVKLRGYDRDEVDQFLYAVSDAFESLLEQNHLMDKELAVLRGRLGDLEGREKILKETLVSAQQIKSEIQQTARKEADLVVREGQLKAEAIYEDAKAEVGKINRQVQEVRRTRNDILAEVEMMVTRFSHFVEAERQNSQESDKLRQFTGTRKTEKAMAEAARKKA